MKRELEEKKDPWLRDEFLTKVKKEIGVVENYIERLDQSSEPFAYFGETRLIQVNVENALNDLLDLIKQFYNIEKE